MHTRCPRCQTRYPITAAQLRAGRGEARCEPCDIVFDALAGLEQTADNRPPLLSLRTDQPVRITELTRADAEPDQETPANPSFSLSAGTRPATRRRKQGRSPRAVSPPPSAIPWNRLTLVLLLVLWIQYLYFEAEALLQNAALRPSLERVCATLGCTLTPYRDLRLIRAGDATLQKIRQADGGYEFRLALSNQSPLPQAFPRLQLILAEVDGKPIAERVFESSEYLEGLGQDPLMLAGKPYAVRLMLVAPGRSIGSYRFSLI